ncbi:MAG: DUF1232 domain-containing protein [Desulfosarcinaceae bacterium]|nr:DUF1232 domain-containing protein [Desulfosarcinaceae bacterium]
MPRKIPLRPGLWARILRDLRVFIALVWDLLRGRYTGVSWRFVIALGLFTLYLVFPLDAIHDAIPILGQLDDTLLFLFVLYLLEKDLVAYQEWRAKRSNGEG